MSYDLYLRPRSGEFDAAGFREYFESRHTYVIQGSQIWYQNEDTGVYFVFEISDPATNDDPEDVSAQFPVAFNMNYFRPGFFGLEAAPELTRVVEHFDFAIMDPQAGGMQGDVYDEAGFLSGWNQGNEFGYSAILSDPQNLSQVNYLPGADLERYWRWNFNKQKLQEKLGVDIFVPRVMLLNVDGRVLSAVVWPDAIPTVLTDVDCLLIHRSELAPRRFFRRQESTDIVPWADVANIIEQNFRKEEGMYLPDYAGSERNESVVEFFVGLESTNRPAEGVPIDQVLDKELVEKHSG